jgi:hypothetical protein
MLAFAAGISFVSQRWHTGFGKYYDTFFGTEIFQHAERSSRLWSDGVCVLDLRVYPFFGSQRQTRVVRPRVVYSMAWLEDYLREHRVDVVVTQANARQQYFLYPNIFESLDNDQRFQLISRRRHFAVFSLRQPIRN